MEDLKLEIDAIIDNIEKKQNEIKNKKSEIKKLKKQLSIKKKTFKKIKLKVKDKLKSNSKEKYKGSLCSIKGNEYEKNVHDVCSQIKFEDSEVPFCTCDILGRSTSKNDLVCNFIENNDIGIEIKKKKTPDWMQMSITYNNNKWKSKGRSKIPKKSVKIFEKIIKNKNIFDNKIPPFVKKKITHVEWIKIKKLNDDFKDCYYDCDSNTISRLYKAKGCSYLQISEKGLYHTGNDICNFGVPYFECDQHIRVRTKIHSRENAKGYMSASITIAAKPKKINDLKTSPYSLDNLNKLPQKLIKIKH